VSLHKFITFGMDSWKTHTSCIDPQPWRRAHPCLPTVAHLPSLPNDTHACMHACMPMQVCGCQGYDPQRAACQPAVLCRGGPAAAHLISMWALPVVQCSSGASGGRPKGVGRAAVHDPATARWAAACSPAAAGWRGAACSTAVAGWRAAACSPAAAGWRGAACSTAVAGWRAAAAAAKGHASWKFQPR
jgi:hypothetical protein